MPRHLCISLIQKLFRIYFFSRFQKSSYSYPTRFSELRYVQPTQKIKTSKYSISITKPYIWNSFLSSEEKQITTIHKFKTIAKSRLLFLENDLAFLERELFLSIRLYDNLIRLQFKCNRYIVGI